MISLTVIFISQLKEVFLISFLVEIVEHSVGIEAWFVIAKRHRYLSSSDICPCARK